MENAKTPDGGQQPKTPGPGIVSSGWLAAESTYGEKDQRRLGRAVGTSALVHGGLLVVLVILTMKPEVIRQPVEHMRLVFVQQAPGPGGGGGGSPAPAPPKPVEIPKPKAEPTPVTPPPIDIPPPPPVPSIQAPVMTNTANLLNASGNVSLAPPGPGGGGRGTGVGKGDGAGVGEGKTAGFGGGDYYRGGGITALRQEQPTYTSEAMRAKIQGSVVLEVEVLENGTVGQVRVVKSLDRVHGLDDQAIKAAKLWLFRPPTNAQGQPMKAIVTLILDFRLY
jgi:protein TonB